MSEHDLKAIKKELAKHIDEKRYEHTIGVADTAAALAMRYDIDMEKAYLAGLLHDCAKNFEIKKHNACCEKCKIELTQLELDSPSLIHARLGEVVARDKYGVKEREILSAIRYHTTGREDMTMLEKIIFSADFIEPNRKMLDCLPEIRSVIFRDLDEAVYLILQNTIGHLEQKQQVIDKTSLSAFRYYEKLHIEKFIR